MVQSRLAVVGSHLLQSRAQCCALLARARGGTQEATAGGGGNEAAAGVVFALMPKDKSVVAMLRERLPG